MTREQISTKVDDMVSEILSDIYEEANAECGDISPSDYKELEELQGKLTDLIIEISNHNILGCDDKEDEEDDD